MCVCLYVRCMYVSTLCRIEAKVSIDGELNKNKPRNDTVTVRFSVSTYINRRSNNDNNM